MTFTTALVAFAIITLLAVGLEIMFTYATQGFGFGFSSNRPAVQKSPLGLRIQRAYQNQVESAAYIVPLLIAGQMTGLTGTTAEWVTLIIIAGRAAFMVLYYTGIPFLRILGFVGGSMGSMVLAYLLLSMAAV
ncbi:MAPEG family protein [uncultured Tateyamaria sp.]|uniref:MAPEG family protein n=1 Tax=uncultured Tateyamaria sp. TaxID=455651 RepID=UPI00260DB843|nr:MAPEG family protein [uncultured Tateyamaria sp.]